MTTTYDIFARKEHPEPLVYIGSVEVENPADLNEVSLAQYGPEGQWIEMLAVPRAKVITVFSEHEEAK